MSMFGRRKVDTQTLVFLPVGVRDKDEDVSIVSFRGVCDG